MHVGHIRSTIIGQALVNIMRALGYRVIGDNHIGDWGKSFGVLLAAIEREGYPDSEGETLLVAFNNSEMPRRLMVELADTPIENAQRLDPLFSARSAEVESGRARIEVPGRTVAIYEVR